MSKVREGKNGGTLVTWEKGQSGNPGGVSKARTNFRKALENAISTDDFTEVIMALVKQAKKGAPWAVREFLDRTLGKDFNLYISGGEKIGQNLGELLADALKSRNGNGSKEIPNG